MKLTNLQVVSNSGYVKDMIQINNSAIIRAHQFKLTVKHTSSKTSKGVEPLKFLWLRLRAKWGGFLWLRLRLRPSPRKFAGSEGCTQVSGMLFEKNGVIGNMKRHERYLNSQKRLKVALRLCLSLPEAARICMWVASQAFMRPLVHPVKKKRKNNDFDHFSGKGPT